MFLRLVGGKKGSGRYWALVESHRGFRGPRQQVGDDVLLGVGGGGEIAELGERGNVGKRVEPLIKWRKPTEGQQ